MSALRAARDRGGRQCLEHQLRGQGPFGVALVSELCACFLAGNLPVSWTICFILAQRLISRGGLAMDSALHMICLLSSLPMDGKVNKVDPYPPSIVSFCDREGKPLRPADAPVFVAQVNQRHFTFGGDPPCVDLSAENIVRFRLFGTVFAS